MRLDSQAVADVVVMAVKEATAKLHERLAGLEQQNVDLRVKLQDMAALRDRIVVIETKTAAPVVVPPPVDLAPLQERVTIAEQTVKELQTKVADALDLRERVVAVEVKADQPLPAPVDVVPLVERLTIVEQGAKELSGKLTDCLTLRDRVVAVEVKAAQPPAEPPAPVDVTPLTSRLAIVEAKLDVVPQRWSDLERRVTVVETKAAQPVELPKPIDISPVVDRIAAAEKSIERLGDVRERVMNMVMPADVHGIRDEIRTLETKLATVKTGEWDPAVTADLRERLLSLERKTTDDTLVREMSALRERVAVLEVRAPMPGPAGLNGKDGADGLGFDDMHEVMEDGGRTIRRRYIRGDRVKEFVHKTAVQIQRGVYVEGKSYEPGDVVTWGGSQWHCNEETTTRPGDGLKAWTLIVKRGRDGRDGKDAPGTPPVVSVKP